MKVPQELSPEMFTRDTESGRKTVIKRFRKLIKNPEYHNLAFFTVSPLNAKLTSVDDVMSHEVRGYLARGAIPHLIKHEIFQKNGL